MKRQSIHPRFGAHLAAATAATIMLSGCYMDTSSDYYDDDRYKDRTAQALPTGADPDAKLCTSDESRSVRLKSRSNPLCFTTEQEKWHASCKTTDCQEVPVSVGYMLAEDLGRTGVTIEAFDNSYFNGAPVASVHLGNFDTSTPGSYKSTSVFLSPGAYYFRAYLNNQWDQIVPYQYQNHELVGNKPLGVFGAISAPSTYLLSPKFPELRNHVLPVHITIDKLLRKPGQPLGTKAFLRLKLEAQPAEQIPVGRKVMIGLYPDEDIHQAPSAEFKMPTEKLLVVGQVGQAEFLTPELEVGKYIVFAWIDSNGNEFPDDHEASAMSTRLGQPWAVSITANRTAVLEMSLKTPETPEPSSPSEPATPASDQQGGDTVAAGN